MNSKEKYKIAFKTDLFSELESDDIISFYDYPRVFTVKSADGLLLVLSEYKSEKDSYSWVASIICKEEVEELNKNNVSLQDLFNNCHPIYMFTISRGSDITYCNRLECIPQDCFVETPLLLGGFLDEYENKEHLETIQKVSVDTNSTVVSFRTKKNKKNYLSVDLKELDEIIGKFKRISNVFGIKNRQSVSLSSGSTLVNFIIDDDNLEVDDINSNKIDSLEHFIFSFKSLANSKDEEDILSLPKMSKTKVECFKEVLNSTLDEDGESEIIIAEKGRDPVSFSKTKIGVADANAIFDSAIKRYSKNSEQNLFRSRGILNGIMTKENKFEFTTIDGRTFKGKLSDGFDTNNTFLVNGNEYDAVIEKNKSSNGKITYVLVSVDDPISLF